MVFNKHLIILFVLTLVFGLAVGQYQRSPSDRPGADRFPWPDGKKAALSLSFDDARPSQIDQGVPFFNRHNVKVTFYVSPDALDQRLEGWKKAIASGHEIGNHSLHHPCSGNFPWARNRALEDYTIEQMREELLAANRVVKEKLGVEPATFAYPCGQKFVGRGRQLKSYVPLVAELFKAGRGWLDESPNDPAFCDFAQLLGMPMDNMEFEELRAVLDRVVEDGQWLVLAGHDIGDAMERQTTRLSLLEPLLKYAAEKGVWVDTVAEVQRYVGGRRGESAREKPPYLDPGKPVRQRVEDLLGRMTLEEKVGQMNMPCVYLRELGTDVPSKMEACRKFAAGTYEEGVGPGGGFFTLANNILHEGPRQQAEYHNELQRIAIENTRLGIPLLQTEEGTHGLMASGGTIYPEGPALGSTWNMDLIRRVYEATAREGRAVGIHQLYTLVIEPNRDPRLGRNQEGYSEDPYLCARMAEVIVRAIQGDDVSAPDKAVAGLAHYPGQSEPVSGLERGAMEISDRTLREVFLPPWVAGIKKAGALGLMATYPAIDGVPAHASEKLLTTVLRGELGYEGLVLGEGGGISTLLYEGLARDQKEAGQLALKAGLDVGISYERGYMQDLVESVREGLIPESLVDRAVRRILELKFRLGLFDRPYVDPDGAVNIVHNKEHQALALEAAREGIVLLKNDNNLLPLRKDLRSIAVIGPNADHARNQLGDYTSTVVLQEVVTVLQGIRNSVSPQTRVTYVKGCDVVGEDTSEIPKAREAAREADVAIVVVGENEWQTPGKKGTNGEGYDVASLDLTGLQEELVRAVFETGTPTVVVLINGRPLSIRWISENVPAILEPWICGEKGGQAVADVLFGDYNPNGKLPITVPRHSGQLPVYYNYKPSKEYWIRHGWGKPYADMSPEPLYEFGFGLSYTTFEYNNLRFDRSQIRPAGQVKVSVDVRNTGRREGAEVVQLYIRDVLSSVVTPVKQLRGFEKVSLKPGESKTVEFALGQEELALLDRNHQWVVEPGEFKVMVGSSSKDIRLEGSFEVIE
jgi:beta-glucosidase